MLPHHRQEFREDGQVGRMRRGPFLEMAQRQEIAQAEALFEPRAGTVGFLRETQVAASCFIGMVAQKIHSFDQSWPHRFIVLSQFRSGAITPILTRSNNRQTLWDRYPQPTIRRGG